MPDETSPGAESPPAAGQFGLRSLLLLSGLIAAALGLGAGREPYLRDVVWAAGGAGLIRIISGGLPQKAGAFVTALAAALVAVAALHCYALETTFSAYVHDGIPLIGWPKIYALGQHGFPPATAAPDFHIYQEPYWVDWTKWRYDLWLGLLLGLAIATIAIRPRRFSVGRALAARRAAAGAIGRAALAVLEIAGRGLLLAAIAWWLVDNALFYDDTMPRFVLGGTTLHRLAVWCLAITLALPVVYPAHVAQRGPRVTAEPSSWLGGLPLLLLRGLITATIASLVCLVLLRGAASLGAWQHHYLNLQRTATLLAIAMTLGVPAWSTWRGRSKRRDERDPADARKEPTPSPHPYGEGVGWLRHCTAAAAGRVRGSARSVRHGPARHGRAGRRSRSSRAALPHWANVRRCSCR